MPPKSKSKAVTCTPQNRHASNPSSDIQSNNSDRVQCNESIHHNTSMLFRGARCNSVRMHSQRNSGNHFSIQFDGQQIQVEERRPSGIASQDERVTQPTWDLLLQYWRNPKKLQETERNKKNRAEDHATHTLGAKSIARHNYEQQDKLGDSYSTLAAYLTAHQTKSGEYPDEYTRAICEKVIETCEERNLTNSSEASILTPVLDAVYNGHHGGYERGRGMGWCRGAWRRNMANEASNDNIRQLTTELQSTQTELQNAMTTIEGMRTREREMEARQQEHMEAMRARERELAETMQAREREMQAQLNQMKAMLSMCLPSASVEDSRSRGEMPHSQPPRQ